MMRRARLALLVAAGLLAAPEAGAEYRQVTLSIFGMD